LEETRRRSKEKGPTLSGELGGTVRERKKPFQPKRKRTRRRVGDGGQVFSHGNRERGKKANK